MSDVPNMRNATIIEFIEVRVYEGEGTTDNVGREVVYYVSLDGSILAQRDAGPSLQGYHRIDGPDNYKWWRRSSTPKENA